MNGGTCRPTDTGASCTCQPGNKLVIVFLSLSFILYHIYIYTIIGIVVIIITILTT